MRSTRDTLLLAAARLIRKARSSGDVTVRKIISAARANLNAVNYHFGSKENLVREAVRSIIADHYRSRGIAPGSSGPGLLENLSRICGFLFAEPVAARLALESELAVSGAGASLTREVLDDLAARLRAQAGLSDAEARWRTWVLVAVVHQLFLRADGCREWLGADPRDAAAREALLARLCALAGVPAGAGDR